MPNLYPALERQEVVVHSPRHVRSFAELGDGEVELVAEAWRRRVSAEPVGYVHAMVNEGRFAGASLPHSHSQLVWLREPPPAVEAEARKSPLEAAGPGTIVSEDERFVVFCPAAGRVPYELAIAPRERPRAGAFADEGLPGALALLREAVRRLRALEGAVPWNAWLHDGEHWHIEVVPRLTILAGIELGAEVYVNPVAPEEAAASLREVGG